MTANEMRTALREYAARSGVTINDLDAMDEYSLKPVYKALIGAFRPASNAHAGRQFVVNGEAMALAQRVKASIDTAMEVSDLAKLPIARLRDLVHQHDWAGYSLNSGADDEGELLRAVTALKNAMQSATPAALTTLGLNTLEGWRKQIEKAVAATSASVARNAAMPYTAGLPRAGDDEFADYDLNSPAGS